MKPILFNTEMVRAILDGRKTTTRRTIKLKYDNTHIKWRADKYGTQLVEMQNDVEGETYGDNPDGSQWHKLLAYRPINPLYKKGDIFYVLETFAKNCYGTGWPWLYKASPEYNEYEPDGWHPSIHMPKEAAHIFLRVTEVRAERLQDITENEVKKEGYPFSEITGDKLDDFAFLWNSTVKPANRDKYGWNANPWVWVIEFEQCEKPKEEK